MTYLIQITHTYASRSTTKATIQWKAAQWQHPFTRYILFDAGHNQLRQIQEGPSTYRANFPALLPGPICFTDASIAPNQGTSQQRAASLGVLITNTQPNETQTITIQGNIGKMSSVIMAEAVAMALAARITRALNLQ